MDVALDVLNNFNNFPSLKFAYISIERSHACVCVCICMYVCMYVCVCVCVYVYIYIYITNEVCSFCAVSWGEIVRSEGEFE
jgi:hypothetical protein